MRASKRAPAPGRRSDDHGSMVLLVTVAVVMTALMAVATAELGVAMVQRQRAQIAADAAALAGVDGGRAEAARLARANGGQLAGFDRDGWTVTVTVHVGDASARASASDGP